jgi:putative ABC transport system permease protein
MFWNSLLLALREIRRNLLRSFLTILGIVIGVSAVITMVTLGNGATQAVRDQISSLGSNLLQVRPGQRLGPGSGGTGAPSFLESDVDAIATQIGGVRAVAPEVRSGVTVVRGARNWTTVVTGTSNAYFETNNWRFAAGRGFEEAEERAGSAVCVIGATVRRELFGTADPLGEQVRVKQFSCRVVGLLASKGQAAMGGDQDDLVILPLRTVQRRVTGSTRINTLLVSMNEGTNVEGVKESLRLLLRERRKLGSNEDDNFNVLDTRQIADAMSGTTQVMTMLLGAVAAVSLLVRHRHHEHHAGERHRAHPRGGHPSGDRRARAGSAAAVPDRGGGAGGLRRAGGHPAGHGGNGLAGEPDAGALPVRPVDQPAVLRLLGGDRRGVRLLSGAPGRPARPDRGAAARVTAGAARRGGPRACARFPDRARRRFLTSQVTFCPCGRMALRRPAVPHNKASGVSSR